ncbi:MAG TPA: SCO family protein [Thermoanaerobaculia bacterium]|nr:SCO family protein [Thermoanaerobaculia bacterium]
MRKLGMRTLVAMLLAALAAAAASAQTQTLAAPSTRALADGTPVELPEALRGIGWEQRLGESVDLEVSLLDQEGRVVRLGEYFAAGKPVLLAPVYYGCPMLCSLVLDGVVRNLMPLKLTPGRDFEVVAVSFDPTETPADAASSRSAALERYRRAEGNAGFHFLTGPEDRVAGLMDQLGMRYQLDPETGLYKHAGGIVLLTPEGRISRYFFGIDYPAKDLRLGLVEASGGQIGSVIDQVLLFCFRYDPVIGKYSAVTMNIIRLAGVATVLALGFFVTLMLLRDRRRALAARA